MKKAVVARESKGSFEFEFPSHLRTTWTSLDNERFSAVIEMLREAFSSNTDPDSSTEFVLGTKQSLRYIEQKGMNVLCVVACIDNGGDVGKTSRIARVCYTNGIPLIFGRGPRELGSAFGKKRVCCVALTKMAASRSELFDFVMNLSALVSNINIPLDEVEDIKDRFSSICGSASAQVTTKVRQLPEPVAQKEPLAKKLKPSTNPPSAGKKKGNFFASFD